MERGNEVWHVECEKPVEVRVTRVDRELARHKLDVMVEGDEWGTVRPVDYTFFHGNETEIINWDEK